MTKDELYQEMMEDMRQEMKEDAYYERVMRTDLEFAMEKLGIDEIYTDCEQLAKHLSSYGWDYSTADVIKYLSEI